MHLEAGAWNKCFYKRICLKIHEFLEGICYTIFGTV